MPKRRIPSFARKATSAKAGDVFLAQHNESRPGAAVQSDDPRLSASSGVPTSRTITTTAPLRIDGGASADLSADRTLSVNAATDSAVGVVELATDGENAANKVVQGNDSRLNDSRTLNGAYDFGGAGSGRTITVDSGPVRLNASSTTAGSLLVDGSHTIASAAGATWNEVLIDADVSVSGSTNITTATGFNMVALNSPTITDAGTMGTISQASTLYVGGAPSASGLTITNAYALWVDGGITRLDGALQVPTGVGIGGAGGGIYGQNDQDTGIAWAATDNMQLVNGNVVFIDMDGSEERMTFLVGNRAGFATTAFIFTGPAHTTQTSGAEVLDLDLDFDATLQHSTGGITLQRSVIVRPRTYSFVGASTITAAYTVDITGRPSAGTNATITSSAGLRVTGGGVFGSAALATNATSGFLYVPSCAGTPTGAPESHTGTIPIVVDSTNHKLYFYSGGSWRDAGP
jgi:hypothetical protein